jgi:ADP-heptose:LPS heptosyltransferase/GT2 family glycosyltransferase
MKRLMKLKFVSPSLQKVVAVVRASNASEAILREYAEAPEDKSDSELLGKLMYPDGTIVPSTPGKILFVIPTYYANEKLERCLKTLTEQHDGKIDYEIVIVNDGGPNLDAALLLSAKYKAKLVQMAKNSGFSAAVNSGIRTGDENAKSIILVNDDLWFKMPAGVFLADVLERKPAVAIAGALLLYPDGRVQHAGITEDFKHILHGQPVTNEATEERDAWAVTGALFAISRRFLNQCGGLDERYQLAWEDTDLCTTAKALGWKIRYCGKAVAYHDEGGTRGNTTETKLKNAEWLRRDEAGHDAFRKKWGSTEDPKIQGTKILIRRDGAIGDVLLTTPVIHALKNKYPESVISVTTEHGYVFRDNPEVSFSLPKEHRWIRDEFYDIFYDLNLAYENSPEKHIVQAYADVCGITIQDWHLRLYTREQDTNFAESILKDGDWIALHLRSLGWPGKEWPSYKFNRLSAMLRKNGRKVVLIGDGSSDPVPNDCDLRGKTTFHRLAAVIKKSKILVGGDSLPLHIAQAVGTPVVGLFGDTFSDKRLIPGSKAIGIFAAKDRVPCLGCHHKKEPPQVIGTCDRPSSYCMEYLSHEDVLKAVESILA